MDVPHLLSRALKDQDHNALPGNSAVEGSSARRFKVEVVKPFRLPLPDIRLLPGVTEESRNPRRRRQL